MIFNTDLQSWKVSHEFTILTSCYRRLFEERMESRQNASILPYLSSQSAQVCNITNLLGQHRQPSSFHYPRGLKCGSEWPSDRWTRRWWNESASVIWRFALRNFPNPTTIVSRDQTITNCISIPRNFEQRKGWNTNMSAMLDKTFRSNENFW